MPQCTNACKAWERGLSGERLRKARHLPACSQTEQMQGRLHIKELLGETNGMKPPEIGYSGEITKRLARAGGTPRGWAAHWSHYRKAGSGDKPANRIRKHCGVREE